MTRYIAIAAVALTALTGAASAMSNPAAGLEGFVTAEQAATLTPAEIASIKQVIHSEDKAGEARLKVNSILLNAGRG